MGEIRQGRKTFDQAESEKAFGPIVVDYAAVQSKVNNKYDTWHKEVINKFGSIIDQQNRSFHEAVKQARFRLEGLNMDGD